MIIIIQSVFLFIMVLINIIFIIWFNKLKIKSNFLKIFDLISSIDLLIDENKRLKINLEKSESRVKNLLKLNIGDRALLPNMSLVNCQGTPDEICYIATYEVEIIELTDKKAKVNSIKVTTNSNKMNSDPSKINGVMNFMKNYWVDIEKLEPMIKKNNIRDDKIDELIS